MTRAWRGVTTAAIATLLALVHPASVAAQQDDCSLIQGWLQFLESMLQFFAAVGDWDSAMVVWLELMAFWEIARSMGC
jgi:hypothetical protein